MSEVFERLREERDRLGLNQEAFAKMAGVTKRTQANYESGDRHPGTEYLALIAKGGADVLYIVTGQRIAMNVSSSCRTELKAETEAGRSVSEEAGAKIHQLDAPAGLTQAQVLMVVLDTLHELKRTLPGEKIVALVDALMAFQRAGMSVDKVTLVEQLRRVK